jgi:hypothetical protein
VPIALMLFAAVPALNWVEECCSGPRDCGREVPSGCRSCPWREEPQRVWSTILSVANLVFVVLITIRMITRSKVRVLLRSIFRRPSQKTLLVKVDDRTWVETSDDPAAHGEGSRNGGAGSRG